MNLIERYLFRRIAVFSLAALAAATAVVLISQILRYVDVLTDTSRAILSFLQLAGFLVPIMAAVVAPFAVLIGVTQVLNAMNADSEMTVIESSGVSHARMAKPVFLFCGLMSLGALLLANVVEPWANRSLREVISDSRADLFRYAIQSGTFRRLDENLIVQISGELPGGELSGIFIADGRDKVTELIYYARRGAVRTVDGVDVLLLADGEIHRRNRADRSVSIITFASYALGMADLNPREKTISLGPRERSTADLLWPDPADTMANEQPHRIRAEIHRRLSEWMYPLLFGLVAVAYAGGAQSSREERLWSIAAATGVALLFRVGGYVVGYSAGTDASAALLGYFLPLATIAALTALIVSGRSAVLPRSAARLAKWVAGGVSNRAAPVSASS